MKYLTNSNSKVIKFTKTQLLKEDVFLIFKIYFQIFVSLLLPQHSLVPSLIASTRNKTLVGRFLKCRLSQNNFFRVGVSSQDSVSLLVQGVGRGGRPTTSISSPNHILLIFSSEPPRNPRPFNIIFYLFRSLKINTFFKNIATLGHKT